MFRQLTISDIITNAFDKDYTMEQAATDLGELMMEPELTKRRHGTDAPRFTELKTLIPIRNGSPWGSCEMTKSLSKSIS